VFKDEFSPTGMEDAPIEDLSLEDIPVYDVSF